MWRPAPGFEEGCEFDGLAALTEAGEDAPTATKPMPPLQPPRWCPWGPAISRGGVPLTSNVGCGERACDRSRRVRVHQGVGGQQARARRARTRARRRRSQGRGAETLNDTAGQCPRDPATLAPMAAVLSAMSSSKAASLCLAASHLGGGDGRRRYLNIETWKMLTKKAALDASVGRGESEVCISLP